MSEPEIDGDASGLFFGQTVRVRAGQCFHQRAFAVVDMAGGGEDEMLGGHGNLLSYAEVHNSGASFIGSLKLQNSGASRDHAPSSSGRESALISSRKQMSGLASAATRFM